MSNRVLCETGLKTGFTVFSFVFDSIKLEWSNVDTEGSQVRIFK